MDWPFWEDLHFGYGVYMPIKNAFVYLVDKQAVYELNRLFFYYKGFALEEESSANLCYDREPMRVYLDALALIKEIELRRFWQIYNGGLGAIVKDSFELHCGKVNGNERTGREHWLEECNSFKFDSLISVESSNVYVKQSDLDRISRKYGIPKNSFKVSSVENKKNFEIGNAVIDSGLSPQDLIIDFTKSVLIQHPTAKTADLRKNFFEDMEDLNPRNIEIINDLLVKAGVKKSGRGEHAKHIDWDNKYPKAQWKRVFNNKK